MPEHTCLLITLYYEFGTSAIKVAVRIKHDLIPEDAVKYHMEPENKKFFHSILPAHVKSMGDVVLCVEEIFEIMEVTHD